jgi:hypothetical protein
MAKEVDTTPGLVPVRLDVTPEVRTALRHAAAEAGLPMSRYVRELVAAGVAEWLPRWARPSGAKAAETKGKGPDAELTVTQARLRMADIEIARNLHRAELREAKSLELRSRPRDCMPRREVAPARPVVRTAEVRPEGEKTKSKKSRATKPLGGHGD